MGGSSGGDDGGEETGRSRSTGRDAEETQREVESMTDYIKCGNNLELMKELPNECIDLTITSPPYDNLRNYEGITWDFEGVARELYRITKVGGCVVWVVGDATINGSETGTSFRQALYFMEVGFYLHDTMIYQKDSNPFPDINRYYQRFEYMFVFSKGKPKTANLIADVPNKWHGQKIITKERQKDGSQRVGSSYRNGRSVNEFGIRGNVWSYSVGKNKTTTDDYAFAHPAMFPEQLAKDMIVTWSNEGDTVFDPFLGSGTTAKMAILTNRHYIGFEISERYCNIARRRINDANCAMGRPDTEQVESETAQINLFNFLET